MNTIRRMLIGAGLLALVYLTQAQQTVDSSTATAQPDTASQIYLPAMRPNGAVPPIAWAFNGLTVNGNTLQLNSVADVQTMLETLQGEPATPFDNLPKNPRGQVMASAFWSLQNPYWPPLPGDVNELDAWPLGNGCFILDDRNFDYAALQAAAEAQAAQTASATPMMRMSMMMSSLSTIYAYANPVYLTNMAASFAYDGSMTANFSIGGGTNFVPYDILMSTNLTIPVSQWNWLGIGYTSNNYTFYEQPANLGFYILAKPSKTITVGIGNDVAGQCDVPYALTNALQVAGGGGQSLALKADGTVVAWGANYYGEGVVPTNLAGVAMVSAGWYHSVALLTNGTVTAWGLDIPAAGYNLTSVPASATNIVVISAQALHTLALSSNGTVVAWGYDTGNGVLSSPAGLTNVTAISAGYLHNLAVSNGYVVAWGNNSSGQCSVPAGISNAVDVAAGLYNSLALLQNGKVVAWGDNVHGESSVPVGLTNVVAIAAAGDPGGGGAPAVAYSMALRSDGSVVIWGDDQAANPVNGLTDVIGIAAGADDALTVRTGPDTPVVAQEPTTVYQVQGSNAVFTARGAGLYGVSYQWQTNGVNVSGATGASLTLTNVQPPAQLASYRVIVGNEIGSIVSSNASFYFVTPPVILSETLPTNQVGNYGTNLTLSVVATAPGMTNGFPLSYQWQFNGSNISGANSSSYTFHVGAYSFGTYSVQVSNAAGSTNAAWLVSVYYPSGLLITQQPTNQFQIAGGTINFYGAGVSSNAVSYQWQFNSTNIFGATNTTLTITNVQSTNQGSYSFVLSDGVGNITSSNANFYLVTPPVFTSQTTPTNIVSIYGKVLSFSGSATSLYQTNGFPLSYQWKLNGTNLAGSTTTNYSFTLTDGTAGTYSLVASNVAGLASVSWVVTETNFIDVTQDLLLIYNTNSSDSTTVLNYYLAHRPGVSGANVLGIGFAGFFITNGPNNGGAWVSVTNTTSYETISPVGFNSQILNPILNWLTNNPTKHPQYLVMMPDVPTRVYDTATNAGNFPFYPGSSSFGSIGYQLVTSIVGWRPFVTHINMNGTNDCIGYINKISSLGNTMPGTGVALSASTGGYGNTNWYFDDSNNLYPTASPGLAASNAVYQASPSSGIIDYIHYTNDVGLASHITNGFNLAGYMSWGCHSTLGGAFPTNNSVTWTGNSSWYLIETVESYNGQRYNLQMSTFIDWYQANAFGGTNYANTPVGAICSPDEPFALGVSTPQSYFGLWASGKNFAICAWNSPLNIHLVVIGDPFVVK